MKNNNTLSAMPFTILASIDIEVIEVDGQKLIFKRSLEDGKYVFRQIDKSEVAKDERQIYYGTGITVSGKVVSDAFWAKLRENDICSADICIVYVADKNNVFTCNRFLPLVDGKSISSTFRSNVSAQ